MAVPNDQAHHAHVPCPDSAPSQKKKQPDLISKPKAYYKRKCLVTSSHYREVQKMVFYSYTMSFQPLGQLLVCMDRHTQRLTVFDIDIESCNVKERQTRKK